MQEKNILNKFKENLGQYCAINQFVELAKRCFVSDHENEIKDKGSLTALATQNSITLTSYNADMMINLISKSYIINTHLCFETFLKEICTLVHKYGLNEFSEKSKDESWLQCAVRNIVVDKLPPDMQSIYELCEYYRLIRNSSVHDLCNVNEHLDKYNSLKKYNFKTDAKFNKLVAPNMYDYISFDDFVMFSRSCIELATYLFDNISYDYKKIISKVPDDVKSRWRIYTQERRERAISTYVNATFKIDVSFEEQLPDLSRQICGSMV